MFRGCVAKLSVLVAGLAALAPGSFSAQEDFQSRFQHASEALRDGRLDAAAEEFSKCISAEPDFPQSYFNLGLVRLQQGRWDDAAIQFATALKLKPDLRGAELFEGMALYRLNRYADAVKSLNRALEAQPSDVQALMWLGMAELDAGDAEAAAASLQKAADIKPGDVDILYHLGQAYMQMSKRTYARMYHADPKSWRVHQVLAQSFREADRVEDAAKEMRLAMEARPSEPGLHQQLGDIYWEQNHLDLAQAA